VDNSGSSREASIWYDHYPVCWMAASWFLNCPLAIGRGHCGRSVRKGRENEAWHRDGSAGGYRPDVQVVWPHDCL